MSLRAAVLFTVASISIVPVSCIKSEFRCKEEGRFADPSDCTSYIECIQNDDKTFHTRNKTCRPHGFDPKTKKCVSIKELSNCSLQRQGRLSNILPQFNGLCKKQSGFICANCNTLINCVGGVAIGETCGRRTWCQYKESFSDAAVCYPEYIEECLCQKADDFKPDPYDDKGFFYCDSYALPSFYRCSEEMVYDKFQEQCVHLEGLPPCTKVGVFVHELDCTRYYTCIMSDRWWVQKIATCPYKKMYSERNSKCEDPCQWVSPHFTCTEEGRFPDKTNCQRFFECLNIDMKTKFEKKVRSCPEGFNWKTSYGIHNKGYCVRKEKHKCEALTPTTCDVPPDWCSGEITGYPTFEDDLFDGGAGLNVAEVPKANNENNHTHQSNSSESFESLLKAGDLFDPNQKDNTFKDQEIDDRNHETYADDPYITDNSGKEEIPWVDFGLRSNKPDSTDISNTNPSDERVFNSRHYSEDNDIPTNIDYDSRLASNVRYLNRILYR